MRFAPWAAGLAVLPALALSAALVTSPQAATPAGVVTLPQWRMPDAYSVDLVVHSGKEAITMKRFIDKNRTRTEIDAEGQAVAILEAGDEKGTTYMLMADQKMALKQSVEELTAKVDTAATEAPEAKVELVGEEKLDGMLARRYRITYDEGAVDAWFDAKAGAPLRMESMADGKKTVMEWKNLKAGPQPDQLFQVPKGYEVVDLAEMMAQQRAAMGGMGAAGGMGAMGGMGGMGGMLGGAAGNMGGQMGAGIGASLGASLGGPLGAAAGQYLGGQIGGWIGHKAAGAVTPGR